MFVSLKQIVMKTTQVLNIMKTVSWIIFISLCIKAGTIIISSFVSLFVNEVASKNLYLGLDLSEIYNFGTWQYINVLSFIIAIAVLKGYLFYLVIKLFSKINLKQPFNLTVNKLITKISHICFSIGIIAIIANGYAKTLLNKGISFRLTFESSEFLFMAGIIFVVAILFKHGIEVQEENNLTI